MIVSALVHAEGRFSPTNLYLPAFVVFSTFSKASLTCSRGASTQYHDSRWGWCVRAHVVHSLSLKTARPMLKILHFEEIPQSSSSPPLHLSHVFRFTFSPAFWWIQNIFSVSAAEAFTAAQVSRWPRSSIHPFLHGLSVLSGKKNISWTFISPPVSTSITPVTAAQNPLLSSVAGASPINATPMPLVHCLSCHVKCFPVSSACARDFRGSQCCGRRRVPFLSSWL